MTRSFKNTHLKKTCMIKTVCFYPPTVFLSKSSVPPGASSFLSKHAYPNPVLKPNTHKHSYLIL